MRYPFRFQNPDLINPFRRDQSANKFLNGSTGSILSILLSIAVYFQRFLLFKIFKVQVEGIKRCWWPFSIDQSGYLSITVF